MFQLVSRHVIEIQVGFPELRRVVGLHQILAGNVITCLEPLLNCQCHFKFWGSLGTRPSLAEEEAGSGSETSSGVVVTLERNILHRLKSLRLT